MGGSPDLVTSKAAVSPNPPESVKMEVEEDEVKAESAKEDAPLPRNDTIPEENLP